MKMVCIFNRQINLIGLIDIDRENLNRKEILNLNSQRITYTQSFEFSTYIIVNVIKLLWKTVSPSFEKFLKFLSKFKLLD